MADLRGNPKIPKTIDENGDRFSSLPDGIIHQIFSYLETIDVIRLSSVSRRWRYLWVSLPSLNLDIDTVWSDAESKWSVHTINDKFKDFVNWVLMSQDGSVSIKKFRLWCYNRADDHTVYRWINIVARRNVEELDLNMYSFAPFLMPHCLVTSQCLLVLQLNFDFPCALKLFTFAGFTRLSTLDLVRVEFLDPNLFRNFISTCPRLENLSMEACVFRDFQILDISSASLRNLTINSGVVHKGNGLQNCKLKLACPNLAYFTFIGPSAADYFLEGLNSLKNVYIYLESKSEKGDESDSEIMNARERKHEIHKFLHGIRKTEALRLSYGSLECIDGLAMPPQWFPVSFENLKTLTLLVDAIELHIFSLLYSASNLEALKVYFGGSAYEEWEMPEEAISCLKYTLRKVELFEVVGTKNELELIGFLLMHGHVLQKMNVNWVRGLKNPREITSRVMEFPRSSSTVVLTFLDSESDVFFYQL